MPYERDYGDVEKGWRELKASVVLQAMEDLAQAYNLFPKRWKKWRSAKAYWAKCEKAGNEDPAVRGRFAGRSQCLNKSTSQIKDCEAFFKGKWITLFTDINGERILEKVREECKEGYGLWIRSEYGKSQRKK